MEREVTMDTPDLSTYKDVHGGMKDSLPLVTEARLIAYLSLFDKVLEKKSKEFYEHRFVQLRDHDY